MKRNDDGSAIGAVLTIAMVMLLCGLLLGTCVAGILLPVKTIEWIFN